MKHYLRQEVLGATLTKEDSSGATIRADARHGDRSRKASNRDGVGQGESIASWAMHLGMAVSRGLELFENGAGCECWSVAVLAQVREEDMA